jgi:hypothetical protein
MRPHRRETLEMLLALRRAPFDVRLKALKSATARAHVWAASMWGPCGPGDSAMRAARRFYRLEAARALALVAWPLPATRGGVSRRYAPER